MWSSMFDEDVVDFFQRLSTCLIQVLAQEGVNRNNEDLTSGKKKYTNEMLKVIIMQNNR